MFQPETKLYTHLNSADFKNELKSQHKPWIHQGGRTPEGKGCCGAPHRHTRARWAPREARRAKPRNAKAFRAGRPHSPSGVVTLVAQRPPPHRPSEHTRGPERAQTRLQTGKGLGRVPAPAGTPAPHAPCRAAEPPARPWPQPQSPRGRGQPPRRPIAGLFGWWAGRPLGRGGANGRLTRLAWRLPAARRR